MPLEEREPPQINLDFAKIFFEQTCAAYDRGDMSVFLSARALVALNLGLPLAVSPPPMRK